ncbi:MAG: M14 family zinc carboxypeptidase [Blautia sp.]
MEGIKVNTYESVYYQLRELGSRYSDFARFRMIGQSHDERMIPMLEIGRGEESLFCTAGIYGREWKNTEYLVRMAKEYCQAYECSRVIDRQYPVEELLDQTSICLIPLLNPDGYEISRKGFTAIGNPILRQMLKMLRQPYEDWKCNARGVDLQGNFPTEGYQRHSMQDYAASENETKALVYIFKEYGSVGYLDFRNRELPRRRSKDTLFFRYSKKGRRIARSLSKLSQMRERAQETLPDHLGSSSLEYYSELTGNPAIAVETVTDGELESAKELQEAYEELHTVPLEFLQSGMAQKGRLRKKLATGRTG